MKQSRAGQSAHLSRATHPSPRIIESQDILLNFTSRELDNRVLPLADEAFIVSSETPWCNHTSHISVPVTLAHRGGVWREQPGSHGQENALAGEPQLRSCETPPVAAHSTYPSLVLANSRINLMVATVTAARSATP